MLAIASTELRGYENPYRLALCSAMSLQDDRRANFVAWMEASELNMSKVSVASGVSYNTIRSYVGDGTSKRTGSLSGENEAKIAGAYNLSVEDIFGAAPGSEPRPNHLRAWRVFRNLTVDGLAAALEVPPSTVELWESTPQAPSDKWLRRVAPHLEVPAGFIADYDPNDLDSAALERALSVLTAPPKNKAKAAQKGKAAAA